MLLGEYKTRSFAYLFPLLLVGVVLFIGMPHALDTEDENQIQAILLISMFAGFGVLFFLMLYYSGETFKIYTDRFTVSGSDQLEVLFNDITAMNLKKSVTPNEFTGTNPPSFSGESRTTTLVVHTKRNEVFEVRMDNYTDSDEIWKLLRRQFSLLNP